MGYEGCTANTPNGTCDYWRTVFLMKQEEYLCKIIAYDEEEETLYLVSEEADTYIIFIGRYL